MQRRSLLAHSTVDISAQLPHHGLPCCTPAIVRAELEMYWHCRRIILMVLSFSLLMLFIMEI